MSISATIPIAQQQSANDALEAAGFGPNSFSTQLINSAGTITHVGLHAWDNTDLLNALRDITNCRITSTPGFPVTFNDHIAVDPVYRIPVTD